MIILYLFSFSSDLMDELVLFIREAIDRKQVNVRRQKRRDALRLQLVRIFRLISDRGTFGKRSVQTFKNFILKIYIYQIFVIFSWASSEGHLLHPVLIEFVDGMRQCLELDTDRDSPAGKEIRTCFALFVTKLIDCFPRTILITCLKNLFFYHYC